MINAKDLNKYMSEHYSYITYNKELAEEYLEFAKGFIEGKDIEQIAYMFEDYLVANNLNDDIEY